MKSNSWYVLPPESCRRHNFGRHCYSKKLHVHSAGLHFQNLAKSLALSFGKSELPSSISEGESIVVTTTVDEKNLGGELGAESLFGKGDKEGQARGL